MIRVVAFKFDGQPYPLFIDETETGYTGKDIMTKPGVYDELAGLGYDLPIAELNGSIDGYATKLIGLLAVKAENADPSVNLIVDYTEEAKRVLTVPETAAHMLIGQASEETREFLENMLEVVKFYESVTHDTKVFLPKEAFKFMEPEVAKKMCSTRHIFFLKSVDNQEITQSNCESEYGIVLPAVQDLHSGQDVSVSSLDILRVCAPYRKEVMPGAFQYSSIYHTPYYKVDPKMRGFVPQHLEWISGFAGNDLLSIQQNERHMYDNLVTFMLSDSATYVSEICTGIVLNTHFGQKIKRFLSCSNPELLSQLTADIATEAIDGVTCNISYTDVQDIVASGISYDALAHLVRRELKVSAEAMVKLIDSNIVVNRVVNIEHLPFVLEFSDEDRERLSTKIQDNHILTSAMLDYILRLCCKAYDVHWGHTGATRSISRLVVPTEIKRIDDAMAGYVSSKLGKGAPPEPQELALLYATQQVDDDDDSVYDMDSEDEEAAFTFDYYITTETMQKIKAGALASDFFTSGVTGAETTEASIVEYWRKVNGDNNLTYFITTAFTATGATEILLQAFYKLMRWGDRKPSLLVFNDFPEIRTVFDLNLGKEIPNTAIVDESQLVTVNGCKHTLAGLLSSEDVISGKQTIVGFLLCKDYGVKKYIMASWVDIGEMVARGEIDIAELKAVEQVPLTGETVQAITGFVNSGYQLFTSTHNIEQGLQLNIPPSKLSELSLLMTPNILRSSEYMRSKQSKMIVTLKDRQYQILTLYVNVLRELYAQESDTLFKDAISTVELSAIAQRAYEMYLSCESNKAPEANDVRAQEALKNMNLSGGVSINYCDDELNGKFTFITDAEKQSIFPPIAFTDEVVAKVAGRPDVRFVLLLLELPDKYVLCRKDITSGEVLVANNKISCWRYGKISRQMDALLTGAKVKANNSTTGESKMMVLHSSLREFIEK